MEPQTNHNKTMRSYIYLSPNLNSNFIISTWRINKVTYESRCNRDIAHNIPEPNTTSFILLA